MADELEQKFVKSARNRQTENAGLNILLQDPRFKVVDRVLKPRILAKLGAPGAPPQAFDAVMTAIPTPAITDGNLESLIDQLCLVEMKTTRKPIWDERLEGFFFGVTESELSLADRLGERYLFAFVVLNDLTAYGRAFFVLLTREELDRRIRSKRTQYQVTLARGLVEIGKPFGVGPGDLTPLASQSQLFGDPE